MEIVSTYPALPDAELSRLLRQGDEAAFRTLYERYWKRLYDMARYRLDESWEAEEVVQDIFCKLWRRRSSLLLDKNFDHYFSGAVKFEVINRLAKRARSKSFAREWTSRPASGSDRPDQWFDYHTLQQQVLRTIDALPHQSKTVFKLRHHSGYSLQQISHSLGISIKTVESHLTRARKTIRLLLGSFLG